jgi:hypothetical protein
VKIRQVKFTVSEKGRFDLKAVQEAIRQKGYDNTSLITGPTEL